MPENMVPVFYHVFSWDEHHHHVVVRHDATPEWLRIICTFPDKQRALDYAAVENDLADAYNEGGREGDGPSSRGDDGAAPVDILPPLPGGLVAFVQQFLAVATRSTPTALQAKAMSGLPVSVSDELRLQIMAVKGKLSGRGTARKFNVSADTVQRIWKEDSKKVVVQPKSVVDQKVVVQATAESVSKPEPEPAVASVSQPETGPDPTAYDPDQQPEPGTPDNPAPVVEAQPKPDDKETGPEPAHTPDPVVSAEPELPKQEVIAPALGGLVKLQDVIDYAKMIENVRHVRRLMSGEIEVNGKAFTPSEFLRHVNAQRATKALSAFRVHVDELVQQRPAVAKASVPLKAAEPTPASKAVEAKAGNGKLPSHEVDVLALQLGKTSVKIWKLLKKIELERGSPVYAAAQKLSEASGITRTSIDAYLSTLKRADVIAAVQPGIFTVLVDPPA